MGGSGRKGQRVCVFVVQKSCGQPESGCESVSVGENSRKRLWKRKSLCVCVFREREREREIER